MSWKLSPIPFPHDLRGPLDAITGLAFLLAQINQTSDHSNTGQMLEQLRISTGNMASLIDDLLSGKTGLKVQSEMERFSTSFSKSVQREFMFQVSVWLLAIRCA